jgi:hypothetical protein
LVHLLVSCRSIVSVLDQPSKFDLINSTIEFRKKAPFDVAVHVVRKPPEYALAVLKFCHREDRLEVSAGQRPALRKTQDSWSGSVAPSVVRHSPTVGTRKLGRLLRYPLRQ